MASKNKLKKTTKPAKKSAAKPAAKSAKKSSKAAEKAQHKGAKSAPSKAAAKPAVKPAAALAQQRAVVARRRIEIAKNDAGLGSAGDRVRQIHVPERVRFPVERDQSSQDPACPLRGAGPVDRSSPGDVMRQSNARQSADGGLAHSRHSSGVIDVCSQVAAGVDA